LADANTGTAGLIRIDVSESNLDVNANTSVVNYAFYLIERVANNSTFSNNRSASVDWVGVTTLWQGQFSFNWGGAGSQITLIASGSFTVGHSPDGTGVVGVQGNMGATGTSGAGGPASVTQQIALTRLVRAPSAITNVVAARMSDTQANLTWTQSNASNGEPTNVWIDHRANGGEWGRILNLGNSRSASIATDVNRKTEYRVTAANQSGTAGPYYSNAIFTTPAAPSNVTAIKGTNLNIVVGFTSNVAYDEHEHEVWHGTVAGSTTTWDNAPLATLNSGVTSYTHNAPDSSKVHTYRVRAKAGALLSSFTGSGSVQLLVAPNKPSTPAMLPFANKAAALTFSWVHNPVDTTPQTAYEVSYSTNGGTIWTSTGKIDSAAKNYSIPANTYAAGVAISLRVRTWGSANTGGADETGASPWSNIRQVTFKTVPSTSITSPANGDTIHEAALRVSLGFTQPESAVFVRAELELLRNGVLLEELTSNVRFGIRMDTVLQNLNTYTVRARVHDSNGLWSSWVSSTFEVTYLSPSPAVVTVSYLPDTGYGQINISIPEPVGDQADAATVTILRRINGVTETVVRDYKADASLTFIDTTPTIHGTNTYIVTTTSTLGAQVTTTAQLVTNECRRAYLSKGTGFSTVAVFGANLSVNESLDVASDTIQAAGRIKPIGLYGVETSVQLKVQSFIFEGFGSPIEDIKAILLVPGKACFRDATGLRMFGTVKGSVSYQKSTRGDLSFTITETS
jgi:hypothetical protein